MTNLKKTLAVVLAFAMILSMGAMSTFAAYSDVEAGTTVSEAVDILSNLEILTGFEDGTFRPTETVTRAQMAAIVCRMLGYEDQAQSSMGTTVFNDVAADHWASGYVNVTQAQGIINGYGDGNFGPEDKVTYEQAVKMIVSALGYDLAAARKGGYPTGYLAIASAEGITKQANGKVGDAAARGTIAVLAYNALDVQLMDQYSWTTDGSDEYGKITDTVLTKYHGIYKYRGTVIQTPMSAVAGGTYDPTATPKATIDGERLIFSDKGLPTWTAEALGTARADKVDVNAYLGKAVIAYAGEDDVTGDVTIFALTEDKSKNDSFKISATQLVSSDEKYWNEANTVGYKAVGSNKIDDITLDANVDVYVNYQYTANINTTSDIAGKTRNGGAVEFISSDADNDYEYVLITAYGREAVVETVEEVNGNYQFTTYVGSLPRVDTEDEDELTLVYKDGAAATVADIAANDTVSYLEIADGLVALYVSSATVTGTVDSYDTDNNVVTIAGEDYEVSVPSGLDVQRLSGEEGTFFLNVDGQIAHNETSPTAAGNYALVLASYESTSGVETGDYLQVVLADGTIAEYKINDNAKVYNADGTVASTDVDGYFEAKMGSNSGATYRATVADLKNDANFMVKLSVSNDKITRVRLLEGASGSADATDKYDAEAKSVGRLDLDDNTIVFAVKQTSGVIEAEDIVIGGIADFFVDDETVNGDIVAYDEDNNSAIFGAIVGFGLTKAIDVESDLFVVTGRKITTIDEADAYVLSGMMAGEEMTITVYDEDAEYTSDPAAVKAGDVLLIAEPDAEGIVSDIQVLVAFDKDAPSTSVIAASDANEDDDIFSGYGKVVLSERNKFAIDGAITNDYDDSVEFVAYDSATGEGAQSYRASAIYTLVDLSENAKNPEVSLESGSQWLFDTVEFESYAYARYIDGRLAEVVVYRIDELN